jgi:transcriptional antiterminator NusG
MEINVEELLNEKKLELESAEGQWYIVRSRSNVENNVKAQLESRIKNSGLEDEIFEVVVPMITKETKRNGKISKRDAVRIPSYILIRMNMNDETWALVRNTPDIAGFLGQMAGVKSDPLPLNVEEVWSLLEESLREQFTPEEQSKTKSLIDEKIDSSFKEGDFVTIIDGPFDSLEGRVTDIDHTNQKVKLNVSIFGRDTPVELNFNQVTK